ncbi:glycosyltransferase [Fibrella sp. ES10-3-2-2]
MIRVPTTPPKIEAASAPDDRPLWSVMIPVYNCGLYLQETLNSVLKQDIGVRRMQIEVVDDASNDIDVESLVKEIGNGRIIYTRQPYNVGSLRNFETCLNHSSGYLIHLLHGDDIVLPGYYKSITSLFEKYPQAGAAFCRHNYINNQGKKIGQEVQESEQPGLLHNWLPKLAKRQRIQYCSITVRREVYEKLGGFYGVTYGEDWEMWTRIAEQFSFAYTPEILAEYRIHESSISHDLLTSGQNLRDLQWVIDQIQHYLPEESRYKLKKQAMKHYAHYGLGTASLIWKNSRNKKSTASQIKESFKMHTDAYMVAKVIWLYCKMSALW